MPTVVEDGANGFLIKPEQISDIVNKLKLLLSNESDLKRLSQNARSTVSERFDIDKYVEKLDKIYAEIVS